MKIVHISGANGWGGNEQQILYIIPELEKLNVENVVFGIENSILQQQCIGNSIRFISVKDRKLNKRKNYSFLAKTIKEYQPDIVHLHTSDSLTFFMAANILYNLKVRAVFSKKGMGVSGSFLSSIKYNYVGINSIICVSKKVQESFSQILSTKNKPKTVVIHDCVSLEIKNIKNNLNLRETYNISSDSFIVGNIANHTAAKDLFTLIDTLVFLRNDLNSKNVYFVQVGEFSKLTQQLKEYAEEKKVSSHLIFMDKVENASALNSQFDAFLLTSQREGGPTSVLEAMLIGTPIVSTDVGVVPDSIKDGENGFVASVKDYKNLAQKLKTLLEDKKLKADFVQKSKLIVESKFTALVIAQETKDEYLKILS